MEILGLAFAVPAVLVANVGYALLVRFGLVHLEKMRPWLLWPSYLVVTLAIIEVILATVLGVVDTRTLIGPAFWGFHMVVFLFGAPSLANVLILTREGLWFRRWYAAAALCCAFGVFLVFFQVGVGDALYGPDGIGGPFSPGGTPGVCRSARASQIQPSAHRQLI